MLGCARRREGTRGACTTEVRSGGLAPGGRFGEVVGPAGRAHRGRAGDRFESLRKAVRAAEAESGERPDLPTKEELAEIRRLRRENEELRRTNGILKLASAYFAQELDPVRRSGTSR
jgi:hypothetical protein